MSRLENKVAIITGAAMGQGAEEVRVFAREGAKVIATDIQEEILNKLVKSVNAEYGEVVVGIKQDVTNEEEWNKVVELAIDTFGKIDILVNNAGTSGKTLALEDTTIEDWNFVMNINATSNFLGMKHVIPKMKENNGGSIVNISSIAGLNGYGQLTPYAASKGANRILSKGAANQFARDNIRVNSVHPGLIDTAMIKDFAKDEETRNYITSAIPLNRLGTPTDVANMVLFLASDESSFVTGAEFVIDGGQTIKE